MVIGLALDWIAFKGVSPSTTKVRLWTDSLQGLALECMVSASLVGFPWVRLGFLPIAAPFDLNFEDHPLDWKGLHLRHRHSKYGQSWLHPGSASKNEYRLCPRLSARFDNHACTIRGRLHVAAVAQGGHAFLPGSGLNALRQSSSSLASQFHPR
jgi:hypothetical protein